MSRFLPAVVAAVLFATAGAGFLVAHHQHGAADHARTRTAGALKADTKALDVLLGTFLGVRNYATTGNIGMLAPYHAAQAGLERADAALRRFLPGRSADLAFISQVGKFLRTDALAVIATRMSPVPPLARQVALSGAEEQVTALQAVFAEVRTARLDAGQDAVAAAEASARVASTVANGAGSAGAILLLLILAATRRRSAAQRVRAVTAATGALEALTVHAPASTAYADSQEHDDRVGRIAAQIAAAMGLPAATQDLLRQAAPLHDVGNVAVPDHILLKPGVLTTDERAVMEQHTTTGAELLADSDDAVLKMAHAIAREHHERWDGLGYPQGLAGSEIALAARIVAVADVFDALTHVRPHRQGATIREALTYIMQERGSQFDPSVVDAFLKIDHRAIDAPAAAAERRAQDSPAVAV